MTATESLRLLLIDDDEIQNFITELMLKKINVDDIKTILNGEDAIGFLEKKIKQGVENIPTHILLDINMPMIDGLTFLKLLNSSELLCDAPVKIAVLTTSVRDQDRKEALSHKQVTHFIEKPITKEKLQEFLFSY